jgi:hypothetical protein
MIIDGKRARGVIPVCEKGDAVYFGGNLAGTTITTVYTFVDYGYLHEILISVPTLAAAANVTLTLHHKERQTAAQARYTSPTLAESATHTIRAETLLAAVIPFKRFIMPGDVLRAVMDAGAGTEAISGFLYIAGV